ncbi:MAG: hypothetical protein PHQ12_06305 [Chthoniobacteraceae bacterium]|nr:hypothetical protein [Chthoniobacteraceae bacterium]
MAQRPGKRRYAQWKYGIALGALLALGAPCQGAPSAAEPPAMEKGFALFARLGLPDSANAAYVGIGYDDQFSADGNAGWGEFARQLGLSGNAWLLKEKGKPDRFVVDNARLVEAKGIQSKPADLAADVQKIMLSLSKEEGGDSDSDSARAGCLLLFAAQLRTHGMTAEADALASRLFEQTDASRVVSAAVNVLANAQYLDAHDRFLAAPNGWQAFQKDLETLEARFGADWQLHGPVVRLLSIVKRRNAPPPALPGLAPGDQALAAELAAAGDFDGDGRSLWLLFPENGENKHIIGRIQARGMQAFPLLIALLNDDYPVRIQANRFVDGEYFPPDAPREERERGLFNRMPRPVTRGEIAALLLESVIPRKQDENQPRHALPPARLAEAARRFYAEHKTQPPGQLALLYLREGNRNQQRAAASLLLREKTEEALAAVERHLLENAASNPDFGLLREWARARGAQARPALENYRKAIEAETERFDAAYRESLVNQVKDIEESISGITAKQILDEVVAGKRRWQAAQGTCWEALQREEPENAVGLLLGAALAEKDETLQAEFLGGIVQLERHILGKTAAGKQPVLFDPLRHAGEWRRLLDAQTPVTAPMWEGLNATQGSMAAFQMEVIYGKPPGGMEPYVLTAALGAKGSGVFRERAEARLAGKPENELPALPSAAGVSADRKKALAGTLISAPGDQLPGAIAGLSLSELLALDNNPDPQLSARLLPLSLRVNTVRVEGLSPEAAAPCQAWKGQPLTREKVDAFLALGREAAKSGKYVHGGLIREPAAGGVTVLLSAQGNNPGGVFGQIPPGRIISLLQSPRASGQISQSLTQNGEELSDQSDYETILEKFLSGEAGILSAGQIRLLAVPAPKTEAPPENE